eukprot:m.10490 g.10490  ORF g.10490 m.10490 type:complete len:475 (+) comp3677_c0_seq1:54-1478(+)
MPGENKHTYASEYGGITCIQYSENGRRLVGGTETGPLIVWAAETFDVVAVLEGHTEKITDVCFVHEDMVVSASHDTTAILWDVNEKSVKFVLRGHLSWIRSVAWLDSKVLTCGGDKVLKIWDIESGYNIATYEGHSDWVKESHFHRFNPSVIISGSFDKTIRSWDVNGGTALKTVELSSAVRSLSDYSSRLAVVVGCIDGSVHAVDMENGQIMMTLLDAQEGKPTNVVRVVNDDELIVAGTCTGVVYIWKIDGTVVYEMNSHTDFIANLDIAPDGTCISADGSGSILVWNINTPSSDPVEKDQLEEGDVCLCCASSGDDEFTLLSCGTQNGKLLSLQLQSSEIVFHTEEEEVVSEEIARQRHSTLVAGGIYADWFFKKGGWKKTLGVAFTRRKRRLCVIEGHTVKYYESIGASNNPKGLKGFIKLNKGSSVEVKDNRLLIHNPDRTWDLESETPDTLARWSARIASILATMQNS